jgi:hypothetical protein
VTQKHTEEERPQQESEQEHQYSGCVFGQRFRRRNEPNQLILVKTESIRRSQHTVVARVVSGEAQESDQEEGAANR